MNKYVTSEIEKLVKECGFPRLEVHNYRPTYTDIQTWLRETFAIDVFPKRKIPRPSYAWVCEVSYLRKDILNKGKTYEVNHTVYPEHDRGVEESGTYDRAFEAGIKEALVHLQCELTKEKQYDR